MRVASGEGAERGGERSGDGLSWNREMASGEMEGGRDWWHRHGTRGMVLGEAHGATSANTCRFLFSMHLLSALCFMRDSYNGAVNHS